MLCHSRQLGIRVRPRANRRPSAVSARTHDPSTQLTTPLPWYELLITPSPCTPTSHVRVPVHILSHPHERSRTLIRLSHTAPCLLATMSLPSTANKFPVVHLHLTPSWQLLSSTMATSQSCSNERTNTLPDVSFICKRLSMYDLICPSKPKESHEGRCVDQANLPHHRIGRCVHDTVNHKLNSVEVES